jgi:hypothetical protein
VRGDLSGAGARQATKPRHRNLTRATHWIVGNATIDVLAD